MIEIEKIDDEKINGDSVSQMAHNSKMWCPKHLPKAKADVWVYNPHRLRPN